MFDTYLLLTDVLVWVGVASVAVLNSIELIKFRQEVRRAVPRYPGRYLFSASCQHPSLHNVNHRISCARDMRKKGNSIRKGNQQRPTAAFDCSCLSFSASGEPARVRQAGRYSLRHRRISAYLRGQVQRIVLLQLPAPSLFIPALLPTHPCYPIPPPPTSPIFSPSSFLFSN